MIINNLLPVPFYEFQCNENLIDKIYNQAEKEDFHLNTNNKITKNNFYHEELFKWLDECFEQVRKIYYIDSITLKIVNCWVNKSKKLEYHHVHNHPNTIVSGILYLTTHSSGETVFYHPNPWKSIGNDHTMQIIESDKMLHKDPNTLTSMITPVKGKLILFPSSIIHGTRPNKDPHTRYTLGINAYPSGSLSWNLGDSNKLYINTLGVRDLQTNKE